VRHGEVQSRAAAAVEALQALQAAALAECGVAGPHAGDADFPIVWHPGKEPETVAEEVMRAASEFASEMENLRPGHVFCYACQSASCQHSQPTDPGEVFAGYESTGQPCWTELFNCLLSLGDDRTDLLFVDKAHVLARFVARHPLIRDQLVSFGRNSLTYRVWGQVVAGYLHVGGIRAGMTVQLIETRDHRFHCQTILPEPAQVALAEATPREGSALARVHDALSVARRDITSLSNVWHEAHSGPMRRDIQQRAVSVLRHLVHSIERKGRQQQRRTRHAEVRAREQRPIHKAQEDLAKAPAVNFFRDTFKESVVVLGRAGRLHVFGDDLKHVTSLTLGRDELERRQRRGRYVALGEQEAEGFRTSALAGMER